MGLAKEVIELFNEAKAEYILWGTKKGDPDWKEVLLLSKAVPKLKAKYKKFFAKEGFDRLRLKKVDLKGTVSDIWNIGGMIR